MKTLRYNTETGAYSEHIGQYKTMDGNYGAIHPPTVQLEVVMTEKPQTTEFQRAVMSYDFQVSEEIDVYGINGTATQVWTVEDFSAEEIALIQAKADWKHIRLKRIVAPIELVFDDVGIKMYGWFQLNGFPIEKVGEQVHLYCNTILEQHQTIVDELGETIFIEDIPEILLPDKPYPSWVFDHESWSWQAPVEKPEGYYQWDEDLQEWVEIEDEELL